MKEMKCSAEDRAKQLEAMILAEVEAGKVKLTSGVYIGFDWNLVDGQFQKREGACQACALGSAARVACGGNESMTCTEMRVALMKKGVATYEETLFLEAGFEDFSLDWMAEDHEEDAEDDESVPRTIKLPRTAELRANPFYKLGRRLRARGRKEGTYV